MLPKQEMAMGDFMARFGEQLFDKAGQRSQPEYTGGREDLDEILYKPAYGRVPFPAQSEAMKALYTHLYDFDAKMAFLVGEMGTGKTTMASMAASMTAKPQRVVVTVPPHTVAKWAREIGQIVPWAKVVSINSAGANRVLGQAAAENPGRPDRPEFYIIGRARLRMDHRHESALTPKRIGSGQKKGACPCCGHFPVRWETLGNDENLPEGAIVDMSSKDDESSSSAGYYVSISPSDIDRKTTCETVANMHGEIGEGCGEPLWQARRAHDISREKLLIKGFSTLPGIGKQMAERIAESPGAWQAAEALENGQIPQLIRSICGTLRLRRIREWLADHSFSLDAGDYAPARFIQNRLPRHWFDMAIFDEVHEFRGATTAQGTAFGMVAGCVRKVVNLTGTLIDGYAQSLHPLLFRADPKRMLEAGFGADDGARFQIALGVIKEVEVETETSSHTSSKTRKKSRRQKKNLPGLHPRVVSDLLLPNAIFVTLSDIEQSIQALQPDDEEPVRLLPSYREVYVAPNMAMQQAEAVDRATTKLMDDLKHALRRGGGKTMLAPIMSALLRYPDDCFRPLSVTTRYHEQPLYEAPAVPLPEGGHFPKEEFLKDLVKREMSQSRRVVVYTTYTNTRDLASFYGEVCESVGARVKVLRSNVPAAQREAWIKQQVNDGVDVVVCNPELVKTGLDLFDFPTMLFMQTGYTTDTILQAARRAWRIGQQNAVRIYYAGYADSLSQTQALKLVAKKIRVANTANGDISDNGLSSLDDDDEASSMQALANSILDNRRDRQHDTITGAISSLEEDDCSEEYTADSLEVIGHIIKESQRRAGRVVDQTVEAAEVEPESRPDTGLDAEANDTDQSDVETVLNHKTTTVLIAGRKTRRSRGQKAEVVAADEVPEGSQYALF